MATMAMTPFMEVSILLLKRHLKAEKETTKSILFNTSMTQMGASMFQAHNGLSILLQVQLTRRISMEEQLRELGKVMREMMRYGERTKLMASSISSEATETT